MKLITRQLKADLVPANFERAYGKTRDSTSWIRGVSRGQLIDKLNALPKPVDPDECDRIIGNTSWAGIECDECGDRNPSAVVQIGQPLDYESHTACVCIKCLL